MFFQARSWDDITARFDYSGRHWALWKVRSVARAMSRRHGHAEIFAFKSKIAREGRIVEVWENGKRSVEASRSNGPPSRRDVQGRLAGT